MKTDILEEIVALNGKCLNATRCAVCPFRNACLPEFLTKTKDLTPRPGQLTQNQRYILASSVLTEVALMDDIPTECDLKRRVKNMK